MTKLQLAKRIAAIVVYGHIFLFAFGLLITLVSPYDRADTVQMILMGSPLLAMVGISAYRFMSNLPPADTTSSADPAWVRMSTATTVAFLVALFAAYAAATVNTAIHVNSLKFIVGAIETILGAYLGINRDVMFPEEAHGK
ncbi:hypothetical protein ACQR16_34495 [Bradyrhizobium oligotrophicum]|uniref:hypothetical protein n=1 Tax=Bradyrhizobium oligotrophicum TaxID=44255 RepID=UPI003EBCBDE7